MSIIHLKSREAPKSARSSMETLLFARSEIDTWRVPPFQRPVRVNSKVMALVEELKADGGIVPGIVTLGRVGSDRTFWIVDGQHRIEALKMSDLPERIMDVRMVNFGSMAEMSEEFVELNSKLVNMRPDDILRSLAESTPELKRITENCEFVSYSQVRRGGSNTALLSMSALLRAWHMSSTDNLTTNAPPAAQLAAMLDMNDADKMVVFLQVARGAWGNDPENYRLWGGLPLTIIMWMWRRMVLERDERKGSARYERLTPQMFGKCLMSVSADSGFVDWLAGRAFHETNKSPCYVRLKAIFVKRLSQEMGKKALLPQPAWSSR